MLLNLFLHLLRLLHKLLFSLPSLLNLHLGLLNLIKNPLQLLLMELFLIFDDIRYFELFIFLFFFLFDLHSYFHFLLILLNKILDSGD